RRTHHSARAPHAKPHLRCALHGVYGAARGAGADARRGVARRPIDRATGNLRVLGECDAAAQPVRPLALEGGSGRQLMASNLPDGTPEVGCAYSSLVVPESSADQPSPRCCSAVTWSSSFHGTRGAMRDSG